MDNSNIGDFKTESGENLDLSIGNMLTENGNSPGSLGRIDRYELVEQLGAGGFGAVYRAHDTVAGINVALKVLPPMISAVPEELENVRSNFAMVSKLKHQYIASLEHLHKVEKVDAAAQEHLRVFPDSYLVVMEYVNGSTLSNWRKQFPDKKVPLDKALDICGKVAQALDFAHSKKIIHRDVKPSNIMISPDGEVKVLDFGLAAEIRSSMGRVSREQFDTSGTRPYMAPEQWAGKNQGPETDQYALACMLYELISGGVPFQSVFESGDAGLMLNLVENRMPEPLPQLNKKQNALLMKALAKKGSDRYASCDEFINAMRGKVKVKRASKSSGGGKIIAVLLIILVLIGAGGYFGYTKYREVQKSKAEQLAREKAAEEERQRQEQLAKETQEKLNSLKKKLKSSFRKGDLSAASAAASEILSIDPQNSYARTMQDRIKEKAGLAETAPVKSRAEMVFERLSRISPEHGFQKKKDTLKLKLNTAKTLFGAKSYGNALGKYQEVITGCRKLVKLDSERNSAMVSSKRSEQEKQSAEKSNASSLAKSIWNSAKSLEDDGKAKLAKGDFSGAKKSFTASEKEYKHAKNYAIGTSALAIIKKQYEAQLAKVKRADIDKFGGADWAEARLAVSSADNAVSSEDWDKALSSYRKAVTLIAKAVEKTDNDIKTTRKLEAARINLKKIGLALKMYSDDFAQHFPATNGAAGLDVLRKEYYIKDPRILTCPNTNTKPAKKGEAWTETTVDYVYRNGLMAKDSEGKPVAWDKPGNFKNFGSVFYSDGRIKSFTGKDWMEKAGIPKQVIMEIEISSLNDTGNIWFNKKDYVKALEFYRKAADKGDTHAMCKIGNFYRCGYGVGKNYTKAMKWYKKAADKGDASAKYYVYTTMVFRELQRTIPKQ